MTVANRLASVKVPERISRHFGLVLPMFTMSLILVILIPLPTTAMDFLLLTNITLSGVVLLTVMYIDGPLAFSSFPSLLLGLTLFPLFWAVQSLVVATWLGAAGAALYAASLPLTAAVALLVRRERARIFENVRVFFLFSRSRELHDYLLDKRRQLEGDLARLARLLPRGDPERVFAAVLDEDPAEHRTENEL